jgi:four helix bundle protein
MKYNHFTEMPVWQKAHRLSIEVFKLTINLPRSEDYGLTSQIRKSSNGAASCISEGFGRSTTKDKKNFYIISRGSCYETENHLFYGHDVGYFEENETNRLFKEYEDLVFDLNKLIKSFE